MSNNGFNPVTGRIVSHEHFAPKWGENIKAPIRKALLEEGITTTEAAKRFNVPHYVASNVRTVLVHQGKLPNRKQIMRETLNHLTNGASPAPVATKTVKGSSPAERGAETRWQNEVSKWKDRYAASESRVLALEEELNMTKALLKKYW